MFQPQPSAQGIAALYQGNPGALQQKIQKDRQAKPGMPQDLSKLMALNIVTNENDAVKRQEAMNQLQQLMGQQPPMGGVPGQPPTVAQSIEAQAKQKMATMAAEQAKQQQAMQAQQQQAGHAPGPVPEGVPQPEQQAQGIDQLPAEFKMAGGGIVAFNGEDESLVERYGYFPEKAAELGVTTAVYKQAADVAARMGTTVPQILKTMGADILGGAGSGIKQLAKTAVSAPGAAVLAGGAPATRFATDVMANNPKLREAYSDMGAMGGAMDPEGALAAAILNEAKPAQEAKKAAEAKPQVVTQNNPTSQGPGDRVVPRYPQAAAPAAPTPEVNALEQRLKQLQSTGNVNVPGVPRPAGPGAPAAGGIPLAPALAKMRDEDADVRKREAMKEMEVLAPSSKYADMAMAEYDRRAKQLERPTQGYGAFMDLMGQIAQTPRGIGSLTAGAMGAQKVKELQKQSEADIFDLTMKKLDLGFKNEEAQRSFKLETLKTGRDVYDKVKDNTLKALQEQGHNDRQASANATSTANAAMQASVAAQGYKLRAEMELRQLINAEKRGDRDNAALQLRALSETAKDMGTLLKAPGYIQTPDGQVMLADYKKYLSAIGKMGGVESTGPTLSSAPPTGGKAVGKV
jgi:hypothetical protein